LVEAHVLVVTRFVIEEPAQPAFVERAHAALGTLAARPGYVDGRLSRALDDPRHWCLVTDWESVGAYRRALSAFDVKMYAAPLLAESMDEPSAYEVLAAAEPGGSVVVNASDRAADPGGSVVVSAGDPAAGRGGPLRSRS
jgi:quinol monooxygenase YgiN